MRIFGLIGKKLGHSFSQRYFTKKFHEEEIDDAQYELFELASIAEFPQLLQQQPNLKGLNVTIPYKEEVIPYLQSMDELASKVGAVNVIKVLEGGGLKGYNTDCIGFERALHPMLPKEGTVQALVLGTGGASKAVVAVLEKLGIVYQMVSRTNSESNLSYEEIDASIIEQYMLVINTTPLGMYPDIESKPAIPYEAMGDDHILFDLVYNPEITRFMEAGLKRGAHAKNGLEMLELQADAAWEIWNE